ncbi:MAG: molecular chaperone TorD family protein [Cocleimonas sp.]|nr:molecular chaperone TorD family protein [Cocleimonas sp.]
MSTITNGQKAVIFAMLGRIFIAELDRENIDALQQQKIASVFEKLQNGFTTYLEDTQWNKDQVEQLASEYCHLFILPQKPGLSLRASHWLTGDETSHLAQLEAIIDDFQFDASVINLDYKNLPGDHLGVLLYFMSSVYSSDDEEIQKLGESLTKLSLLPWIFKFNEKLSSSTNNPIYLAGGKLLLELLSLEE